MQKAKFNGIDVETSRFGIGCMRLPIVGEDSSKIDEKEAIKMIRYGIDNGVTYIDTAYPYHGGESENLVGKALSDGYRKKVKLATKFPTWELKKYEDFENILDKQLEKLQTDYIDFYLLHALNKEHFKTLKENNYKKFLDDMVKKGKIRYPSFSFHDDLETFKKIIDDYDYDMAQIQLNIMDTEHQAGLEGMRYAQEKGVNIVVMEPLRGGRLTNNIPENIQNLWKELDPNKTPANYLFKWLTQFDAVKVILSGVSTMEQLKENIKTFNELEDSPVSEKELDVISRIKKAYNDLDKIGCTGCEYCMPCPEGVDIPGIFATYYEILAYNLDGKKMYKEKFIDKGTDASKCVRCGQCEEQCPQSIEIMDNLAMIDKELR